MEKVRIRDGKNSGLASGAEKIWIRDEKNSDPGSGMKKIRNRDPGWKKFGSGIRDGKNSDPGSGMEKIRIRDKHPESATVSPSCLLSEGGRGFSARKTAMPAWKSTLCSTFSSSLLSSFKLLLNIRKKIRQIESNAKCRQLKY
jgi:hypothetical protein